MKGRRHDVQATCGLVVSLLGAAICSVVTVQQPAFSEEGSPASVGTSIPQPRAEQPAAIPGAAGMTVYIDPQTGAILREPAPGTAPLQLTPQERNAFSTSDEGLVAVPSPVPGGGVKVDLQGRFQSPLIGTIDANGKARVQHLPEPRAYRQKQ